MGCICDRFGSVGHLTAHVLAAGFVPDRFFATGEISRLALAVSVALAVLLVGLDSTWRYVRYAITTVHELGHVVVGWFVGRTVESINLNHDTSGLTMTRGRPDGIGYFFLYVAGYTAPPVAGFVLLASVIYERAGWGMAALTGLLLVALIFIRNAFGVLVLVVQLVVYGGLWYVNDQEALGWLLLLVGSLMSVGGTRAAVDLVSLHRRRKARTTDAAILGRQTRLGAMTWAVGFVAFALVLLVVTALMLWQHAEELL